ncbi:hypothetical protein LOZ66_003498 [Ophidiomyces ophidiicola]|nr:hypothetical protein LOZ66_003498 [Ophidiomyces ophidiicola]
MDTSLRPQFFISRQDGSLTALIAVDELPLHMSIRGIPRLLNQNDTQGMTSLGSANHRGLFYSVDHFPQNPGYAMNNICDQKALPPGPKNGNRHGKDLFKNNHSNPRQAKGCAKKEYCSFWLRHGECDYQQQGCIFKHEMPRDPITLEKLGLRDIPRWYRDKHNVKSIAASIENARARANRSNVQTVLYSGKQEPECLAIEASNSTINPNNMGPSCAAVPPASISGPISQVNLVNGPGTNHHITAKNNEVSSTETPGHRQGFDIPSYGGPTGFSKVNITNLKDKENTPNMDKGLHFYRQAYPNIPNAVEHFTAAKNGQTGTNYHIRAMGQAQASSATSSQDGRLTSVPKPGTKSLWALHRGAVDISELPLSPFPVPKSMGDFTIDQELPKKHQKSRRLYQPRNDAKSTSGQEKLAANDDTKRFYPFGVASPLSVSRMCTPNIDTNVGSYCSPSSSGNNSSAQSTRSSLAIGTCTKTTSENLYYECTASMTGRAFEKNNYPRDDGAEFDLFDLGINDDVPSHHAAF